MWRHPVSGAWRYLADKAARKHIPVYYLGTAYRTGQPPVPWHYPFVMLAVTTPLLTLACGGVAATRFFQGLRNRWKDRSFEALVLLNAAFPVFLFAMPGTPKYDGARLLMTAFPFLAILAGLGAEWLWTRISSQSEQKIRLDRVLGVACVAWLLIPMTVFHPFQLGYYNELVGGPWGAHALGFETTYWGDTLTDETLQWLNENAPPNARVARLAVGDFVWKFHRITGALRRDLLDAEFSDGNWDFLLVVPRQGMLSSEESAWLEARQPVWRKTLPPFGKLPLCEIYRRAAPR